MKTIKHFSILSLLCLALFCSCSSEYIEQPEVKSDEFILKSGLNLATVSNLSKAIDKQFSKTRSTDNLLTEGEAKELLLPFLEDGKNIQKNILNAINTNSPVYQSYSKMTEQELIILSMLAISNEQHLGIRALADLSSGDIINCIGSALGIAGGIEGLSISGLVSAQTGLQVLKAVAKRYAFGYIGLAISIYQFGDCINDVAEIV